MSLSKPGLFQISHIVSCRECWRLSQFSPCQFVQVVFRAVYASTGSVILLDNVLLESRELAKRHECHGFLLLRSSIIMRYTH